MARIIVVDHASLVEDIYSSGEGRPSYRPLTMVKVLLLEQWYNLSDPQMEEALSDRISFRRFVGLGLEDDTPDHSTISRFRCEMAKRSLGIKDRIMHRSHKHQSELPHWQKRRNELIDPRRKLVEKVFGTLKCSYDYSRVRHRGLGSNGAEMWFKLMAYNFRKAVRLTAYSG